MANENEGKGWHEAADHTGKAPEHRKASIQKTLETTLRAPMKKSNTPELKIRDTKITHALYQGHTYRQAIEDSISNLEVELQGGKVRVDDKRFTFEDKGGQLLSDPVYETKFWLEAYSDGRLLKLPLNRAEVDYYNKLKSEYKRPERIPDIETPERIRFNLQDRVDNAKKSIRDWTKLNDADMIKTWEKHLTEREQELAAFDAGHKNEAMPITVTELIPETNESKQERTVQWDATFKIQIPKKTGGMKSVEKSMHDLNVSSHTEAEDAVKKEYPNAYMIHISQLNMLKHY